MLAPAGLEEVHPLGKSPVVTIESSPGSPPLVLAESGLICQYLCEHFAGNDDDNGGLMPRRWKDGHQHDAMAVRRETDEWLRWMYYLHYVEGSFMPLVLVTLIVGREFFSNNNNTLSSPLPFSPLFFFTSSSSSSPSNYVMQLYKKKKKNIEKCPPQLSKT